MKILIQLSLTLAILLVIVRLLRTRSARGQAVRRLAAVMFGIVAVLSVIFPASWTVVANFFGVGRGADMVLYSLVVAFLSYTVTSYARFRDLEARYTLLVRRVALGEAPEPPPEPDGFSGDTPAST